MFFRVGPIECAIIILLVLILATGIAIGIRQKRR
jgi:hypothetical protein